MSKTFDDIAENATALFVIGSNLTEQHPVFGAHIRQAILRRKLKMIVANPDFINLDEYAALTLRHSPNTETALLNGLMHILLEKGVEDRAFLDQHPQDFVSLKNLINHYTPQHVAEITGLTVESLYQAAEILAQNRPTAVIWSIGLADPATIRSNVHSLVNLQVLLGNQDRPGGGLAPLRSQNNSQGASDMGALPAMLPGYLPLASEDARRTFEAAWGVTIPPGQGLSAFELINASCQGQIKALYILGEDIINSFPEAAQVRRALESCGFVILQEIMPSETTRYADVLLPGVSFAEKTGTFTSSERRVQLINQAIQPIGSSCPDWQIISALARRLLSDANRKVEPAAFSSWDYADSAQIMLEIAALNPLYTDVSHARILEGALLQWPVLSPAHRLVPAEQIPLKPVPIPEIILA
jgi:formate dehydrogenase major subunit/formate dehydrogenase alpha subunit